MKATLFSLFIAVKVVTFAAMAFAAHDAGHACVSAAPPGLCAAAEPLSGGYRRRNGESSDRV